MSIRWKESTNRSYQGYPVWYVSVGECWQVVYNQWSLGDKLALYSRDEETKAWRYENSFPSLLAINRYLVNAYDNGMEVR